MTLPDRPIRQWSYLEWARLWASGIWHIARAYAGSRRSYEWIRATRREMRARAKAEGLDVEWSLSLGDDDTDNQGQGEK